MSLKIAMLLALLGVSLQFMWSLLMSIRTFQGGTAPLMYRLSVIPTLLFQLGLILFFVTLLRKQRSSGAPK
ncbi:MAG: hypothetical protein ABIH23_18865 [bacterium]